MSDKTNAMRILDQLGIEYESKAYDAGNFVDGLDTADKLGLAYELVYKTLVTKGVSREHYVFVLPINRELDLKKAARSVGEKSLEMLPVRDITRVTGYIRGGCTSIGMKKAYKTVVSDTASCLSKIHISAGKIGMQLALAPNDLCRAANAVYADILAADTDYLPKE